MVVEIGEIISMLCVEQFYGSAFKKKKISWQLKYPYTIKRINWMLEE